MNAFLLALAGTLLLGSSPWAVAASSVDLTVKGSITPSACSPSISNNGLVDYGKISAQDLNLTDATELPKTTFKFAVNCEGATLFALHLRDNRLPMQLANGYFVLGLISPIKWIGAYFLDIENLQADDPTAYPIYSFDNGASWQFLPDAPLHAFALAAFGKQTAGVRAPVPIKDVSLDLVVRPLIYPKNQLPEGESIPLDGSATFELRYL